jgi:hypothetical protein
METCADSAWGDISDDQGKVNVTAPNTPCHLLASRKDERPRCVRCEPPNAILKERPMRLVYMDEAGISASEPIATVAGVIVDGDRQWKRLQAFIEDLIKEYVPAERRENFVFHAKHIFHGTKFFHRTRWPLGKRLALLKRILSIPAMFSVPVAFGYYKKVTTWSPESPRKSERPMSK